MAILKNALIAASVLASYAVAVPLAGANKREMVVKTYTETFWVTQNQQATVWVDDSGKPVKTDLPTASGAVVTVKPTSSSSTSSAYVASSSAPAAAAPPASSAAAPVAPSSSAASAPSYSPAGFAAQPSPSPSPASASSAPAAAASPAPASSAAPLQKSSSGPCVGQGSGCAGDITHWDGGLGACGWNVNTNSDMQIALPYALMGTQSNGNPYCGKSLTIKGPSGNLVKATVGDKCMGCTGDSIDLTNVLFSTVAPNGDGRVSNIEWWFD